MLLAGLYLEWYNSLTDTEKFALVGGVIALVVGLIVLIVVLASPPHLPSCLKEGGTYTEVGSGGSGSPSYSSAWTGGSNPAYPECGDSSKGCKVYGISPGNNGEACATWCAQFVDSSGKPYGAYKGSLKTDDGLKKPVPTDFCTGADPTAQGEQQCFCAPQCASSLRGFKLASDCPAST